ncbi:MAG: hypothetical protein PWR01_4776 [Clostridiales bacterium]|jgi:hypothetical protein|nr:hypothetical protein [Clostridiales bacterium]MDN5283703.1 hypothetical protein [Candidatus Ozemobacter sp.]
MKSFDRYLVKFFYLAVFSCLIVTAFLVGCGGSNNPAGPSGAATSGSVTGVLPTTATGSVTLTGLLINAATGNLIDSSTAKISVKASLIGTTFSRTVYATENKAFTVFELPAGNYLIEFSDEAAPQEFQKFTLIKELSGTKVDLTVQLSPTTQPPGRVNFFGTVVDAAFAKPIQFVTIKLQSNSGLTVETSTLFDGTFSLLDLASGTYEISFEKSGFEIASKSLILNDTEIRFGTKTLVAADFKNFTDGANVTRSGYDLGSIVLAPRLLETGGISGILLDSLKNPLANTSLDLVYDSNTGDAVPPASIIPNFKTNDLGYFMAKNLPPGFYLVAYPGYQLFPITDGSGNIVGYSFGQGGAVDPTVLVTRVWLEVKTGSVTPIPELE